MNLFRMAWKYVWARPLVSLLTSVSVLLGTALVSAVLLISQEAERTLAGESGRYDLIVGAKGSPLQLVLSSVYHLDVPTGNIPFSRFEALAQDRRVAAAVPIGLGDNYQGFRIVGTTTNFFHPEHSRASASASPIRLAKGRLFTAPFEAVLGSEAARQSGLIIGDPFVGTHGLAVVPGAESHHEFPYRVVGVLAPSGMSIDRAIYTDLASVWLVHDREAKVHASMFNRQDRNETPPVREVTSVLLKLRAPGMRVWMADEINTGTESMAAIPVNELTRLYQRLLLPARRALLVVAGVVVTVSILSMIATLYQSAERRRRDVAILRMLGAHPREIFFLIVVEAVVLVGLGIGCGLILSHGGAALASASIRASTGLVIQPWQLATDEAAAVIALAAAGFLAGLISGALGYRRVLSREVGA